jgi:NitT/TauT family transport system ATP-binding protein
LNALAGFLKPSGGRVTVDGEPISGPSADRGMIFQQYSLFPWKTVRQNVEFGLKMSGVSRSERERRARTLLGLAGLTPFEDHYPDRLSGGMKQRVGIVRALATGPRILPPRRAVRGPRCPDPADHAAEFSPTCGSS